MHDYVMSDLFFDIEAITSKKMFGGYGFYKGGIIFAIMINGQLYFKVDNQTRPDFETLDSHPFSYKSAKNKTVTMSYWTVPESVMEDHDQLLQWIENAVQVSLRSKKPKSCRL